VKPEVFQTDAPLERELEIMRRLLIKTLRLRDAGSEVLGPDSIAQVEALLATFATSGRGGQSGMIYASVLAFAAQWGADFELLKIPGNPTNFEVRAQRGDRRARHFFGTSTELPAVLLGFADWACK